MKTKHIILNITASAMAFAARSCAGDGYWDARFGGQGVNGMVNAVAVSGSDVYVGGSFTRAGSVNATNIAKWNGSNWSALGGGVNNQVYAIAVQGTNVYAGGKFTAAGGISVNFIARWNGTSWSALGSGLNNGVSGYVYTLAAPPEGQVGAYAGGIFGSAIQSNGSLLTVNYITRWNGSSWSALGGGVNSTVYGVTVVLNDVYVGGEFTTANYYSFTNVSDWVTANHIAKWNGSWSALTDIYNRNGVDGYVNAISVSGSDVYVGGNFRTFNAGGGIATNIARFGGGPIWRTLGAFTNGVNNYVTTVELSGTNVYVGGAFTQAGGTSANRIARWDGYSWTALSNGLNSTATALGTGDGHVYVGGGFTTAGGKSSEGFAIWHETPVVRPNLIGIKFNGADCQISFTAQVGREYYVERKGNLAATNWFAFTNVISGTSGIITVADPGAANNAATRFYRVRSQ